MKKLIILISSLFISLSTFAQIPNNGIVGYYPFNGNANDISGNNNNGVTANTTLTIDRFGNANSALNFNGTNSYLRIANNPIKIDFSNSFTLSMWVKVDSTNSGQRQNILSIRHDANANDLGSWDFGFINDTIYTSYSSKAKFTTKRKFWEHIIFTYDKTTKKITSYNNAIITGQDVITNTPSNSSPIQIGAQMMVNNPSQLYRYFKGSIDDILVYNRVLTNEEIKSIYIDNAICYQKTQVSDTLKITSLATTGLNDLPLNFGTVKVYPNPTSDILNIVYDNPSINYSIKLTDNLGNVVYASQLNEANTQLNISSYSKGLYMIQILNNTNNILDTKKIIFQ